MELKKLATLFKRNTPQLLVITTMMKSNLMRMYLIIPLLRIKLKVPLLAAIIKVLTIMEDTLDNSNKTQMLVKILSLNFIVLQRYAPTAIAVAFSRHGIPCTE